MATNCSMSLASCPNFAIDVVLRARVDCCNSHSLSRRSVMRRLRVDIVPCICTTVAVRVVR